MTTAAPADLETVPDFPAVPDSRIVEVMREEWAQVSRAYARFWAAMVVVADRTTDDWEVEELAAGLTFTRRRAQYEVETAQLLVGRLPLVYAALANGSIDHLKARTFASYLLDTTREQAERICSRLVPKAPALTTGQLAARLLREVQAIDPDYARRTYEKAVQARGVHGYLDHTGTAVLTGFGLPAPEAAAAAARLEVLADRVRAGGYPATVAQTRADLYLRLLDGTLDGLGAADIVATMLTLGPLRPSDSGEQELTDTEPADTEPADTTDTERTDAAEGADLGEGAKFANPVEVGDVAEPSASAGEDGPGTAARNLPARCGVEVRVKLSTLLGLDEHLAELPGWGPIPAAEARALVACQHAAEWRIAITDDQGYLLHGDLTRRRPGQNSGQNSGQGHGGRVRDCLGGIVEIAVPEALLQQLPTLAVANPDQARLLDGIIRTWTHRHAARAALDEHPNRRFAHAALRRHVQMRDRTCVGPGCRRTAHKADLDHTRDHAHGGQTTTANSGPCCGRDHALKDASGWTLHQPRPGHFTWTSPLGQTYDTRGDPVTPDLPDPLPRQPEPHRPGLPLGWEGPILRIPVKPAPPRPPPVQLPDEPPF